MTEDEIILSHILKCRPIDLAIQKPVLTQIQQELFENYRRRRAQGEPLQYILGTCNFMGLELAINPSVLIPRPETEQLTDHALQALKGQAPFGLQILDLGTGSGNIAIALAKFLPKAQVISIDASQEALDLAYINAQQHAVEDMIKFVYVDMTAFLSEAQQRIRDESKFDLIISNPPYIPITQLKTLPEEVRHEPVMALDGGEDGLNFHRVIIKYSPSLLRAGGCLMMEFGDGQAGPIQQLMEAQMAFSSIEMIRDLAQRKRIIKAIL